MAVLINTFNSSRHLSNEDAGNYKVVVKNKHGEKANHVRLSMKDENAPKTDGIEPTFFRKPSSRQEGKKLHLECEIEALPRPDILWYLGDKQLEEGDKYTFYRAIQPSNPNIHFVRLTITVSLNSLDRVSVKISIFRSLVRLMEATTS